MLLSAAICVSLRPALDWDMEKINVNMSSEIKEGKIGNSKGYPQISKCGKALSVSCCRRIITVRGIFIFIENEIGAFIYQVFTIKHCFGM